MLEYKDLLQSHLRAVCRGKFTQDSVIGFMDAVFVAPCQDSDGSVNNNAV